MPHDNANKGDLLRISDIELAKAVIAHEGVDCFLAMEDRETSPQPTELVSCIGGVFWGRRGERWPRAADGTPLFPWLQIVCTEMKRLYGPFHQRKTVSFYLREEFLEESASSTVDGSDFVVREYELTEELAPLDRPPELAGHPFHRVRWKSVRDYPSLSKYYSLFDGDVYQALCAIKKFKYDNHSGIKIGGWPTPVQRDQQYPGAYDLQIDMTENFTYADSGIAYVSSMGDRWVVEFECC